MTFRARQPGCPCCDETCFIVPAWDVIYGDWVTDPLSTEDADALVVSQNEHPYDLSTHFLSATAYTTQARDRIRVIVSWKDEDNYIYGEIETAADDDSFESGWVSLYHVVAGTETQIGSTVRMFGLLKNTSIDLYLCYDGTQARFSVQIAGVWAESVYGNATAHEDGTRIGFATKTLTGALELSDVFWQRHVDEENPDCAECRIFLYGCEQCKDKLLPGFTQVVLEGITGSHFSPNDCELLNGTYILPCEAGTNCVCAKYFPGKIGGVNIGCTLGTNWRLRLRVLPVSGGIESTVVVYVEPGVHVIAYTTVIDYPVDCMEFNELELTGATDPSCCIFSAGKAIVTSL